MAICPDCKSYYDDDNDTQPFCSNCGYSDYGNYLDCDFDGNPLEEESIDFPEDFNEEEQSEIKIILRYNKGREKIVIIESVNGRIKTSFELEDHHIEKIKILHELRFKN